MGFIWLRGKNAVLSSNYVPQVQCESKYRPKGFVHLYCEMSLKGADFPKSRRTKELIRMLDTAETKLLRGYSKEATLHTTTLPPKQPSIGVSYIKPMR